MGTISEKLQYTANAVDDIQNALAEKGVEITDTDELATYGDKIRELSNLKVYSRYVPISSGEWTGIELSDSSWKNLGTSAQSSIWTYYFDEEIDIKKIKYISGAIIERINYFRITKGYASGSTTAQYQYTPTISLFGNADISTIGKYNGGISIGDQTASVSIFLDDYDGAASKTKSGDITIEVYSNKIQFCFQHIGRVYAAIKSTVPYFSFSIAYNS